MKFLVAALALHVGVDASLFMCLALAYTGVTVKQPVRHLSMNDCRPIGLIAAFLYVHCRPTVKWLSVGRLTEICLK